MSDLQNAPLHDLAVLIHENWTKPYFGAVPYIEAMANVVDLDSPYGADDGRMIVAYFLANAHTWRGETARAVKAELKRRLSFGRRTSPDSATATPRGSSFATTTRGPRLVDNGQLDDVKFAGHADRECGEHRTLGGRAWCHDCTEYCYPTGPCRGCELPALRAERDRLWEAANWLLICQRDVERRVPVRGLDEAWEGLRVAVEATDKDRP